MLSIIIKKYKDISTTIIYFGFNNTMIGSLKSTSTTYGEVGAQYLIKALELFCVYETLTRCYFAAMAGVI